MSVNGIPTEHSRTGVSITPPFHQELEAARLRQSGVSQRDCALWIGATAAGYGVQRVKGTRKNVGTHRVAFEEANGPAPEGYDVAHLCNVKLCQNAEHLVALSRKDHAALDADLRVPPPESLPCAKEGHEARKQTASRGTRCVQCQKDRNREYMRRVRVKTPARWRN